MRSCRATPKRWSDSVSDLSDPARVPELVHIAERTLGDDVVVRDHGLLESALTRPQATVFGADAYG